MINNNSAPLNIKSREEQNTINYERDQASDSTSFSGCGISSELVSLINLASFLNSLIATKEIENRMQYIHRSCDTTIFWLYVKNLNLFEIDKLAYDYLQFINNPYGGSFLAFFEQRLTKVNKAITPIAEIINFKNKLNQEVYRYKMSAFDFGWYNIDKILKDPRIAAVNLILKLKNEQTFDEIQLTLLIPSKKVSLQLLSKDENTYFVNKNDLKLPIGEQAELILSASRIAKPTSISSI